MKGYRAQSRHLQQRNIKSTQPGVQVHVSLCWDRHIGNVAGKFFYNSLEFFRVVTMPILPAPFTFFAFDPEWIMVEATDWKCFENSNGSGEIWLDCKSVVMHDDDDPKEVAAEMVAAGWMKG